MEPKSGVIFLYIDRTQLVANDGIFMLSFGSIPGVPKKAECSIFDTLIFENIAFFLTSSDETLSSEKNDTKIIEIGGVVLILWSFLKTW